jgi:hypothetical protein
MGISFFSLSSKLIPYLINRISMLVTNAINWQSRKVLAVVFHVIILMHVP